MKPAVTGIILAGGQGRRMGHTDKGLQPFRGEPLIAHVLARFAPQVDEVLINEVKHYAIMDLTPEEKEAAYANSATPN